MNSENAGSPPIRTDALLVTGLPEWIQTIRG